MASHLPEFNDLILAAQRATDAANALNPNAMKPHDIDELRSRERQEADAQLALIRFVLANSGALTAELGAHTGGADEVSLEIVTKDDTGVVGGN